jgi:hypothetical protein
VVVELGDVDASDVTIFTMSSPSSPLRKLLLLVSAWTVGVAAMVGVAAAVVSLTSPDPLPAGVSVPAQRQPPPSSTSPSQDQVGSSDVLRAPGTCVETVSDPDPLMPPMVSVVDCAERHDVEVIANLPVNVDDPDASCSAAATAVGVPVDDPSSAPMSFAVAAQVLPGVAVECTVSTPSVTGSIAAEGFTSLARK